MESVEKLRGYIEKTKSCISPMCRRNILIISDEIEQEHKDELLLYRNAGYKDGYNEGFASADDWCADNADELREHGWVRLPKDVDGEYIHVGDVMERGKTRGRVIALMLSNYPNKWGGGLHWAIQLEGEQAPTALDNLFHHYHVPTVEDMLAEFAAKLIERSELTNGAAQTIAEYAPKLQLRKD